MQHSHSAASKLKGVPAVPSASARYYYISQLFGWGLYGVVLYFLSPIPVQWQTIILAGTWGASGLVGTHILKLYVNRRWQTISQLIVPLIVAALLIPAAMTAARIAVGRVFLSENYEDTHGWVIPGHYVQGVLVVVVWCAIFLVASEAGRRRLAEKEALQLALVAQTLQFRALRSQLNPHFLFNCLNSLRELIDEDRHRAKQVVDRLAELLRYTLRADRVELVSLREELQAVKDYLSLEKVRFEERLRVTFTVDPRSLEIKLPPMLLQTLVENAVKHGIAQLQAGGDVSVITRVCEAQLLIEVTNTGTLSLAVGNPFPVGLDNTRERLRLMYGDKTSLTLTDMKEGRVRAAALLPVSSTNGTEA